MSKPDLGEPSDLGGDIVQGEVPTHLEPTKVSDFKPWHRTHKHFIRVRQWNASLLRLIQEIKRKPASPQPEATSPDDGGDAEIESVAETAGRVVRYFTLPGDDLLDLHTAVGIVHDENCTLQFLGFNEALNSPKSKDQSQKREAALTMRDRVAKRSRVKAHRFQDIGKSNAKAWHEFKREGPYDAINLDLCDSLVPGDDVEKTEAIYTALDQLLKYQVQYQSNRWVLFVTTQIDPSVIGLKELVKLIGPTCENMRDHAEFDKAMSVRMPGVLTKDEPYCDIAKLNIDQLTGNFGVILGKWLCKILLSGTPICEVKLVSAYRYRTDYHKQVEMLSLAFVMVPHFVLPADQTGLSALAPQLSTAPSEKDVAMAMLSATETVRDVDELLSAETGLRDALVTAQADLLEASGYDRQEYLKWVLEGKTAIA
jgi:hypothetical protein